MNDEPQKDDATPEEEGTVPAPVDVGEDDEAVTPAADTDDAAA